MDNKFEVRDRRDKAMFRVDDEYLNGYSKLCGPNASLVYFCLCRHADIDQECFPSVNLMAEKLGISRDSVMRGIKELIKWNIISKERERKDDAKWLNNRYVLLDKKVWKSKPSSCAQLGSQVANEGKSQVAVSDSKVTHIKVTHNNTASDAKASQDISEFIYEFRHVNPSYDRLFMNKTERDCARRLIDKYGLEKMKSTAQHLKDVISQKYAPKITTPYELEKNLGKLVAFVNQNVTKNIIAFS